jgi:hypothetical protein
MIVGDCAVPGGAWVGVGPIATGDGFFLMKQSATFPAFAMFAFVVGSSSSSVRAEQANGAGPVRLNAPPVQASAPVNKPKEESRIQIRLVPAPRNVGGGQDGQPQRSRTDGNPQTSAVQQVRQRAVYREVARRITIAGGLLVLPKVVYYGAPVILNVPGVGYVDVPEDEYARLYEKLSSSNSEQVQEAMSALRRLKEAEEAEVEALQHVPRTEPDDIQDLSEPIFFHSPSSVQPRRKGLY